MNLNVPKTEKNQNNFEQIQKEALGIAQAISRRWEKLKGKSLDGYPKLEEIYGYNRPPKTGIQSWFDGQIKFIEEVSGGDEDAKNIMMHRVIDDLQRFEKQVNDIIEGESSKTENSKEEQNEYGLSSERYRELVDAKNMLKEAVENISPDNFEQMGTGTNHEFLFTFKGDVNKYVSYLMNEYSNYPKDKKARQAIENLRMIKEGLLLSQARDKINGV